MTQPQSVCGTWASLRQEGAPEEDALAVIERLYAGLFYDALFDFYDDVGKVNAICLDWPSGLAQKIPDGLF